MLWFLLYKYFYKVILLEKMTDDKNETLEE